MPQNYYIFNNTFYQQKDGLPTGSLLVGIFMSSFESNFSSNNCLVNSIHFWDRYVDDVLCIWSGTDRQLKLFLGLLTSFFPEIKFTLEIEVFTFLGSKFNNFILKYYTD